MGNFFIKAFDVELQNSLTYPSASMICETLYNKETFIEFISKVNPVIFKKDDLIFMVDVKIASGGYKET